MELKDDLLSLSALNATLEVSTLSMSLKLFQLKRKYACEHQPVIFNAKFTKFSVKIDTI